MMYRCSYNALARLLHALWVAEPSTAARRAVLLVSWVYLGGCLVSPPIEPSSDPNLSPRIQPLLPDQKNAVKNVTREFLEVNGGVVTLSADLYDPNREPELFYLFLRNESGALKESRAPLQPGASDGGPEFYFGNVSYEVDPCLGRVNNIPGAETVTLYVTDRGFYTTSADPTQIVTVEGALMVAYSWTLKYEAGICDAQR